MSPRLRRVLFLATTAGLLAAVPRQAAAAPSVPSRPDRYATDQAGVIDAARLAALNERLAQFERDTSNQVLVFVDRKIPEGTTLEEYANACFHAWKVGQKDKDNGVVFFAFIDDRRMRIEVGYGLEPAIPDARTKQILDLVVTPRFKAGDLTGGVEEAASELMQAARGEAFQGSGRTAAESGPTGPLPWWLWLIPVAGGGIGLLAAKRTSTLQGVATRGGIGFTLSTAVLSMLSVPLTNDIRPMAMGFGVLLLGGGVAIPVLIGQDATVTGRRRVGLGLIQAGAGLLVASFGFLALSAGLPISAAWGGYSFLLGILALPVGGIVHTEDPARALTVTIGRLTFVIFALSSIFLALVFFIDGPGAIHTLDWVVVSGITWLACWIYAHGRGWKLAPDPGPGGWSSGGGSGGYSSWSSSGYSSSSGSSSSYSGGGGDSGGGGSSGSW